jgi:radical SAM superfamily enzyme with C-terminal helix-hairpin-helix motif
MTQIVRENIDSLILSGVLPKPKSYEVVWIPEVTNEQNETQITRGPVMCDDDKRRVVARIIAKHLIDVYNIREIEGVSGKSFVPTVQDIANEIYDGLDPLFPNDEED